MTQKPSRPYRFWLSAEAVDERALIAWLELIQAACGLLDNTATIELDRPGLRASTLSQFDRLEITSPAGRTAPEHDRARQDLVVISDAAHLSPAMLSHFDNFHVLVQGPPTRLNLELWFDLLPFADQRTSAQSLSAAAAPWRPDCALISSVYDGDDFILPFLENCAALDGYAHMEHFLVLAASPGNEHEALVQHVHQHPGAACIWLHEDPGLYEVWNLCARLASARYLSSANIDDRRAPQHVARLVEILDQAPDVDVASTALRITEQPNLSWDDSAGCPVWYGSGRSGPYHVERLWRGHDSRLLPNNIPHCMPVWRNQLHINNGKFDEQAFGASADWEFWLRAGKRGARFYLLTEPLGLHLRRADSYWRRHSQLGQDQHTRMIIQAHVTAASPPGVRARLAWFTGRWLELDAEYAQGDWLRYFWLVNELWQTLRRPGLLRLPFAKRLQARIERELDFNLFTLANPLPDDQSTIEGLTWPVSRLLRFLVDIGHASRDAPGQGKVLGNRLRLALRRLLVSSTAPEVLIALAWAHGLGGDRQAETGLLRLAHQRYPKRFWSSVQSIYRFTVPLRELGGMADKALDFPDLTGIEPVQRLFFYPDYSRGNPYQRLLYQQLATSGARITGIGDIAQLESGEHAPRPGDVLHIHWINRLYRDLAPADYAGAQRAFLATLDKLKARGVRIYWTIHNRYSHDCADIPLERAFRRELSGLADRMFLHHPCLIDELGDWLPAGREVQILEHGHYIGAYDNTLTRQQARKQLGFDGNHRVLTITGMIKPYKDIDLLAGQLHPVLKRIPNLKLVVAGPVYCTKARQALEKLPADKVMIKDAFVPAADFQRYLNAADFALFSYRDILTSGSLFQALGFAVPVLAPALGSIPAYVVDGWNGRLYQPGQQIGPIIEQISRLDDDSLAQMRHNALTTARSLRWP